MLTLSEQRKLVNAVRNLAKNARLRLLAESLLTMENRLAHELIEERRKARGVDSAGEDEDAVSLMSKRRVTYQTYGELRLEVEYLRAEVAALRRRKGVEKTQGATLDVETRAPERYGLWTLPPRYGSPNWKVEPLNLHGAAASWAMFHGYCMSDVESDPAAEERALQRAYADSCLG